MSLLYFPSHFKPISLGDDRRGTDFYLFLLILALRFLPGNPFNRQTHPPFIFHWKKPFFFLMATRPGNERDVHPRAPLRPGYVYVKKGNPYITRHCRQLTLSTGKDLFKVVVSIPPPHLTAASRDLNGAPRTTRTAPSACASPPPSTPPSSPPTRPPSPPGSLRPPRATHARCPMRAPSCWSSSLRCRRRMSMPSSRMRSGRTAGGWGGMGV